MIQVILAQTYYNNTFFNVSKVHGEQLAQEGIIHLIFDDKNIYEGIIDRSTDQIRLRNFPNEYSDYIQRNFRMGDVMILELVDERTLMIQS